MRVDGIDTSTRKHRPRQLGTFASQRSATAAARSFRAEETTIERRTVSWLVRRYVESRNDITVKAKEQYAWAIPYIEGGLGAIRLARLDREDVAAWIEGLAAGGRLSRRSVQICRNVLRAALNEAVDEGLLVRSPAARVGLPRSVAKPVKVKETNAWSSDEIDRFLEATSTHRWAIGFRLGVLFGLRRSEVLALRWDDVDVKKRTLRIDESLVATRAGASWGDARMRARVYSSRSTPRRCVVWLSAAPSRPPNDSRLVPSGATPDSSSRRDKEDSCSPVRMTVGALDSRIAIEQAKGMIAERERVDMDQAFSQLRTYARSHNLGLTSLAEALVAGTITVDAITSPGRRPPPPPGRR